MASNVRYRYSYSGSGWSVRSIDPVEADPKPDALRRRRLALVVGASALAFVVAGSAFVLRHQPQIEQPSNPQASHQDFIVPSPVIPADVVGSIPGLPRPAPAVSEPSASELSRPEPQSQPAQESVIPSADSGAIGAAEIGQAQPGTVSRPALKRAHEQPGQVAHAVLSFEPYGEKPITSPVIIGAGQQKRVVLFTDLRDLSGQTVFHRWEYRGQTMAIIPFKIGGNRWRVHSSKTLTPALKGQWQAVVTDARGTILASRSFDVR